VQLLLTPRATPMCNRSLSHLFETEVSRLILLAIACFHGSDRLASVVSASDFLSALARQSSQRSPLNSLSCSCSRSAMPLGDEQGSNVEFKHFPDSNLSDQSLDWLQAE
jgi:hypothetical protein